MSDDEPTLDAATLDGLRRLAGAAAETFLTKLVATFLESCETYTRQLRTSVAAGDAKATRDAAHAIKGACLNLGCKRSAKIASEMEDRARAGESTVLAPNLDELNAELARARAALEADLKKSG